jgi:hypothetical protein
VTVGGGGRRQPRRLAGSGGTAGRVEVAGEDPPRDPVHREVVDDQQQPRGPLSVASGRGRSVGGKRGREVEPGGARQGSCGEIEAALQRRRGGSEGRRGGGGRQPRQVEACNRGRRFRAALDLPPLGGGRAAGRRVPKETQAERRMVRHHRPPGARRDRRRQRHPRAQQHGLVEMMGIGVALREEPALDRRELQLLSGGRGRHRRPSRAGSRRRGLGHRGEGRNGRVLEQLPRCQPPAGPRSAGHDLQAEDRVAAEVEEVVVRSDAVLAQDLPPDADEQFLGRGARRHAAAAVDLVELRAGPGGRTGLRKGGQAPAVELAMGGQRHRRKQSEIGRHHVVGQAPAQGGAQASRETGGGCCRQGALGSGFRLGVRSGSGQGAGNAGCGQAVRSIGCGHGAGNSCCGHGAGNSGCGQEVRTGGGGRGASSASRGQGVLSAAAGPVRHDECGKPPVSGGMLAHQHRRLGDLGMGA